MPEKQADPSGGLGPPGGTARRTGTKETSRETGAKSHTPGGGFPVIPGLNDINPETRRAPHAAGIDIGQIRGYTLAAPENMANVFNVEL